MRILFAGTPATAATVLEGLLAAGHEVVCVLTREDAPLGRKKILTASPVAELATTKSISVIKANRLDSETLDEIAKHQIDLAIVVAYGVILKEDALNALPVGWFNLHYSLLPIWRGAAPVQRALQHGDVETGVTLFKIDAGLDTGPILSSVPTVIQPEENAGELLTRLSQLAVTLLNEQLPRIYSSTHNLEPQVGEFTLAPKITRAEAKIDFTQDSTTIENLVRAMNPEPMAWCSLSDEPMRILRARAVPSVSANHSVGQVFLDGEKVLVTCGNETALELLYVQPASRTSMNARDWLNGLSGVVTLR
jgi:methionyl-tRNA formyltransferase